MLPQQPVSWFSNGLCKLFLSDLPPRGVGSILSGDAASACFLLEGNVCVVYTYVHRGVCFSPWPHPRLLKNENKS
jgi:hypothetical protein